MVNEKLYSIGQVSKLCRISRKALRYYEELGLITPDKKGKNNYRYYSKHTMLKIPVIKYYKAMGFSLDEMRNMIGGCDYNQLLRNFRRQVEHFEELEREIFDQKRFVSDWRDLIVEAQTIINNNMTDVSVSYQDKRNLLMMPYEFEGNYADATINIDFTNHVDDLDLQITGPVIIAFPWDEETNAKKTGKVTILQRSVYDIPQAYQYDLPAGLYASTYHIGSLYEIDKSYERLVKWLDTHNYKIQGPAYERYVVDYWTTPEDDSHVTEILLAVTKG